MPRTKHTKYCETTNILCVLCVASFFIYVVLTDCYCCESPTLKWALGNFLFSSLLYNLFLFMETKVHSPHIEGIDLGLSCGNPAATFDLFE